MNKFKNKFTLMLATFYILAMSTFTFAGCSFTGTKDCDDCDCITVGACEGCECKNEKCSDCDCIIPEVKPCADCASHICTTPPCQACASHVCPPQQPCTLPHCTSACTTAKNFQQNHTCAVLPHMVEVTSSTPHHAIRFHAIAGHTFSSVWTTVMAGGHLMSYEERNTVVFREDGTATRTNELRWIDSKVVFQTVVTEVEWALYRINYTTTNNNTSTSNYFIVRVGDEHLQYSGNVAHAPYGFTCMNIGALRCFKTCQ